MKAISLISLDTVEGVVRRYIRTAGNKARETGRMVIKGWDPLDDSVDWPAVGSALQKFRAAYTAPDDPGPHPTPPIAA